MDQAIAIRDGRTRLKMSQELLAKAAEVSQRTVMRAEGGRSITFENLRAICSVLGLDATSLVSPPREKDPSKSVEADAGDVSPQGALSFVETLSARYDAWTVRLGTDWKEFLVHLPFSALIAALHLLVAIYGMVTFFDGVANPTRNVRLAKQVAIVRGVTAYANAVVVGSVAKMTSNFEYEKCEVGRPSEWLFGHIQPVCRVVDVRIQKTQISGGDELIAVGPISPDAGNHVVRRLSRDPSVVWSVAWGRSGQSRNLAWFDPRSVAVAELPQPSDDSWLFVRIHRNEGGSR